jgi:hemerythrin superfamily protein
MAKAKTTNILSLIETDHRTVEQLFQEAEKASGKKLYDCFAKIYTELNLHARAEELTFYPAMREYPETEGYIEEAESEHEEAETLLEQLKQMQPDSAEFKSAMKELEEAIQHHVEEEESEIFEAVRQCMEDQQLTELGEEFQAAKARLQEEVQAAIVR